MQMSKFILKKTIISDFFSTISFSQMLDSLFLLSIYIKKIEKWEEIKKLEKRLLNIDSSYKKESKKKKILSFYNARSAIYHALKIIWIEKSDEVIVNSYTCSVVCNSVIKSRAKIVYSDIERDSLSFDLEKLIKNINKNTKVIILQNSFWKKHRDYEKIIKEAKKRGIIIIEDLAHGLVLSKEKQEWDFLVFSSWRDKVISSIGWWFLVVKNKKYFSKLQWIRNTLQMPTKILIIRNLFYNIIWYLSYKFYDFFSLWKLIIFTSRKLNIITEILSENEKKFMDTNFNLSLPNSLAYLWIKEFDKLEYYTKKRLKNAWYYLKNIKNSKVKIVFEDLKNYNWFRFPILLKSKKEKDRLIELWRKNKIIFWTSWSGQNIVPSWIDLKKAFYKKWKCKIAENISERILTLPSHKLINKNDLDRVVNLINNF